MGLWWGGFLLGGLLLLLVSIPFFSFPKVLTHEKEKIRLMEKAAAANPTSSNAPPAQVTTTKNDSAYGKDIKGKFNSNYFALKRSCKIVSHKKKIKSAVFYSYYALT